MRTKATFLPARPRRVKDAPCPRQGRSEVRDAKKNERHVCGRARAGERPVSQRRIVHSCPPTPSLPRQALVPWPYGEPLNDARTPLADFFRILLGHAVPQTNTEQTTIPPLALS